MKRILALIISSLIWPTITDAQLLIPEPVNMQLNEYKTFKIKKIVEVIDTICGLEPEAYTIATKNGKVTLTAADIAGMVHARATLAQLVGVGPEEFMYDDVFKGKVAPEINIADKPAFPVRGFMHDTGRNFREVEMLKRELDLLAFYKLNVFHWHLTDNPAWRIECKAFPQLNDPQYQRKGRDEGRFYTYDQIREIIGYAQNRGITVIPEIDMPGHSQYFDRTFGFGMASEQGMDVLKVCLEEFMEEIPAELCPYIHIGSDEVHVSDPRGFMQFCEDVITKGGRTALAWYPGLPSTENTISQIWSDEGRRASGKGFPRRYIDSYMGYLNLGNPIVNSANFFLHQLCSVEAADDKAMGGILCLWNDVRVADKTKTFPHNGMPEGLLGFAQSSWGGGKGYEGSHTYLFPKPGTEAYEALAAFEKKMSYHRDNFLEGWNMRWVANATIPWEVSISHQGTEIMTDAWGGCVDLNAICRENGFTAQVGDSICLTTRIHVDRDTVITAWVGFDSPSRSTRMSDGIGKQGQWENGGRLFVSCDNDQTAIEIFPPNPWDEPEAYRYHHQTWHQSPNELPYTDEQFFWMRDPAQIPLKAGWNIIKMTCPCRFKAANWHAAFIPIKQQSDRYISEADGLRFC